MNDQPGLGPQTPNQNRRNFFLYAAIALLIMMLLNAFVMPMLHGANITEVDYGTFVTMLENKEVKEVELQEQENEIVFSRRSDGKVYKTGMIGIPS